LYPTLLGLDWAFDNQANIKLKKREMIFGGGLRVTMPLDIMEERRYVVPARQEIDNLYNMTMHKDSCVNPIMAGALSCRSISSYASDLKEEIEY